MSPVSGSSRNKSARSPIQNKFDHKANGKGLNATDHGVLPPQSNLPNRLKADTGGRHLSAGRPVTPGSDHSSLGRAASPSNLGSPLITPRVHHGGAQSANKTRKKHSASERQREENTTKRWRQPFRLFPCRRCKSCSDWYVMLRHIEWRYEKGVVCVLSQYHEAGLFLELFFFWFMTVFSLLWLGGGLVNWSSSLTIKLFVRWMGGSL